jgi:hypothetical protein
MAEAHQARRDSGVEAGAVGVMDRILYILIYSLLLNGGPVKRKPPG